MPGWRSAFVLAAALAAVASIDAPAQDYPPLHVKVVPVKVTARAWYVQGTPGVASSANEGYNANAGFVVTDDGVVVIDALGSPALGNALLGAIRKITPRPVKRVLMTHYHADHFYGLAPFKAAGAEIWAHYEARDYLATDEPAKRREQRARDLFPWVDEKMPLVPADRWLDRDEAFTLGGVRFEVYWFGPAHSPEDLVVVVPGEGVIFCGDLFFTGRVPFVGDADSKAWLERIERLIALKPRLMVPGHGAVSKDPAKDLGMTRDYLTFLRAEMGKAVEEFVPFEEAYKRTNWSRFEKLPAFRDANRGNAYSTYLLMEKESLQKGREVRRRDFLALAAATMAPFARAEEAPDLPLATDLKADGEESRRRQVPIVLLYSLVGCPYCNRVRREFLWPMMANAQDAQRAIWRQVNITDGRGLADFTGARTTHMAFARTGGIVLAPVVVFLDGEGKARANPIKGMLLPDFYGYYLDEGVKAATRAISGS